MKYDFYITGTIGLDYDWWTGQRGTTSAQLKRFLDEHKDKEVTIAVSSFGGYLDEGITMGEMIAAHGKCNMVIIGMTASAATVLCMKAKSVKIAKGSMMLIHNSSYTLDVWTTANKHGIDELLANLKKNRADLDTFDKAIAEIYSTRNGKAIEDNLAMMDKEQWMLAKDAFDFGIVDDILDDDATIAQAQSARNAYARVDGLANHFGLPDIPAHSRDVVSLWRSVRDKLSGIVGVMNAEVPADKFPEQNVNTNNMKKIIFNLVCGVLAVKDIAVSDKGEAVITENQLKALEDAMKAKDDLLAAAQSDKQTANAAKAEAERKLTELQKEFDDFKNEAGDDTKQKPVGSGNSAGQKAQPIKSADLYNEIKSLI